MTNQQLAVLLLELHGKFTLALDDAVAQVPPEARKTVRTFFGTPHTFIPALTGIKQAVDELKEHADLLSNQGVQP